MTRAWVIALVGCARFDLAEPIQLVADPSWSAADVATLDAAGTCWNLRFGTQFESVASPSLPQVVDARYNTFACWGGEGGNFQPGEPAGVDICPVDDWPSDIEIDIDVRLFTALVHELGHASGIRTEAHGLFSVMGGNQGAGNVGHTLFSSEDVQLLHDAAPDFALAPVCDDVTIVAAPLTRVACACR